MFCQAFLNYNFMFPLLSLLCRHQVFSKLQSSFKISCKIPSKKSQLVKYKIKDTKLINFDLITWEYCGIFKISKNINRYQLRCVSFPIKCLTRHALNYVQILSLTSCIFNGSIKIHFANLIMMKKELCVVFKL